MKRARQVLSIILVCCLLLGIMPVTANAITRLPAGNLTQDFSEDGVLAISGTGPVNNCFFNLLLNPKITRE